MTDSVRIEFSTEHEKEVPRVGHRKTIHVNGAPEIMWVKEVTVMAKKYIPGEIIYEGNAWLTQDIWV